MPNLFTVLVDEDDSDIEQNVVENQKENIVEKTSNLSINNNDSFDNHNTGDLLLTPREKKDLKRSKSSDKNKSSKEVNKNHPSKNNSNRKSNYSNDKTLPSNDKNRHHHHHQQDKSEQQYSRYQSTNSTSQIGIVYEVNDDGNKIEPCYQMQETQTQYQTSTTTTIVGSDGPILLQQYYESISKDNVVLAPIIERKAGEGILAVSSGGEDDFVSLKPKSRDPIVKSKSKSKHVGDKTTTSKSQQTREVIVLPPDFTHYGKSRSIGGGSGRGRGDKKNYNNRAPRQSDSNKTTSYDYSTSTSYEYNNSNDQTTRYQHNDRNTNSYEYGTSNDNNTISSYEYSTTGYEYSTTETKISNE